MVFAALACLLVATSIALAMLHSSLRARRQLHTERDRRQCEMLLQLGAERARVRLAADTEYRGEVINVPSEAVTGRGAGRITTQISPQDSGWRVRVQAEYPLDQRFTTKRSQEFDIAPMGASNEE